MSTRALKFDIWTIGQICASEFVAAHPPGSAVTVFYDPASPATAVLESGFDGRDIFLPLFLLPFNVVMLGFLRVLVVGAWNGGKGWSKLQNGIRMIDGDGEARIRMPGIAPLQRLFSLLRSHRFQ